MMSPKLIVSLDSLSFSGLTWKILLVSSKPQRPAYHMIGHSPIHCRDQCMVSKD